jgi:hypothetical protein
MVVPVEAAPRREGLPVRVLRGGRSEAPAGRTRVCPTRQRHASTCAEWDLSASGRSALRKKCCGTRSGAPEGSPIPEEICRCPAFKGRTRSPASSLNAGETDALELRDVVARAGGRDVNSFCEPAEGHGASAENKKRQQPRAVGELGACRDDARGVHATQR